METPFSVLAEDLGTTRPAYRTWWIPLLNPGHAVVVAVADRVVPLTLRRAVRTGQVSRRGTNLVKAVQNLILAG